MTLPEISYAIVGRACLGGRGMLAAPLYLRMHQHMNDITGHM